MRLLAVIETESISGPAKNLLEFARLARAHGIETIVVPIIRGELSKPFIDAARNSGVSLEVVKERHVFDSDAVTALKRAAERVRPHIVQTHAVKSHFLVRCAGLPRMTPWVAFHHGYTRPAARVALYNQFDRWSLRAAHKAVTVSLPFREELARRGVRRGRIEVVHNAIAPNWGRADAGNPEELRSKLGIPPGRPVILSVGRLSKEKDHLTLLKAARLLPPALEAHLVIVGDGPERALIQRAIAGLKLQGAVTLTGHQPSIAPYYGIAQAVVISSRSEGSPNVLLEAMAFGVPVVATSVGGIPEHVEPGDSALLVPPGEPAGMSLAIAALTGADRNLARRLVERSNALIRERHSPEARVQRLMEIYRAVVDGPAGL